MSGKGDTYRPFNRENWDKGWKHAFGGGQIMPNDGAAITSVSLEQPEFQKFSKIPRLSRDMIITEKIDGTNAQIYITEDGQIFAGSRRRWLTVADDNYRFAAWVEEHKDELITGLGPGRHYGEWWGSGIQRRYGLNEKRFSLFNAQRWHDINGCVLNVCGLRRAAPGCCYVVPVLYIGPFCTDKCWNVLDTLRISGSIAAPGFMRPEGIVICHVASGHLYKKTFEKDTVGKGDE